MAKLKLNLGDYDGGFDPIPEGKYNAYVFEVKPKKFSTGSEGYSVQYKVADGKYKGRRIFDNIVLSEKAYFKVVQFFKAVTGNTSTGDVEIETDEFKDYVGKMVEIKVAIEDETADYDAKNVIKNVKYIEGENTEDSGDLNDMLANRGESAEAEGAMPF